MKVKKIERENVKRAFLCGACGATVSAGAQFCPICGGEFIQLEETLKDGESSLAGENYEIFNRAYQAILENNLAEFDSLLEKYPEMVNWVNGVGESLLTFAVYNGRKSMISLLLAKHADSNSKDEFGHSPYSIAKTLAESYSAPKNTEQLYCEILGLMKSGIFDNMSQLDSLDEKLIEEVRNILKRIS